MGSAYEVMDRCHGIQHRSAIVYALRARLMVVGTSCGFVAAGFESGIETRTGESVPCLIITCFKPSV